MEGVTRRNVLKAAAISPLVVGGFSQQQTEETETNGFTLLQGNQGYGVLPFRGEQTVEEFYQYRTDGQPHSHFEESREETSLLMLYRGPEGVSLVISHDEQDHSASSDRAGIVKMQFDGLPESGSWVVKDDPGDWRRSENRANIHWRWNDKHTDGGAFRGNLRSAQIRIDPDFQLGIGRWIFLTATPPTAPGPLALPLDPSQPVTVAGPEAEQLWILPNTDQHVDPLAVLSNREGTVNLQVANGDTMTHEGLTLDATATAPTEGSGTAAQSTVELDVLGTDPSGEFAVQAQKEQPVDVDISTGDVAGTGGLSASLSGSDIDGTVEESFDVSVVDPVTVETTITSEVPAVTGRDAVIEFAVTANDAAGVDEPALSVTVSDLPRGWEPKLEFTDSQPDGGEWTREGGDVRWTIDRIAPGLTLTPELRLSIPEGGSESAATLSDTDQLRPPGGDFEKARAKQAVDTTVTVPGTDGTRRTVEELTTEIPITEKRVEVNLSTPDERFAGGGRIPIDVTVQPTFDGSVAVDQFSLEVNGVPLSDPDVPDDEPVVVETSEDRFQDLLRTDDEGLDSRAYIEEYAQSIELSQDDPIEFGFEFEPPVSVDASGSHDLFAIATVQLADENIPTRYSDIGTITVGEPAALGRLAIDCNEQIDDLAQPSGSGNQGPISETPEVEPVVQDLLDAADDDSHSLTVEQAGDALERLLNGERIVKRTIEATEPPEPGDGESNLCWRTAESVVLVVTIIGIVGKIVGKLAKALKGSARSASQTVGKFLADDIGEGLVVSTTQNLGSVSDSIAGGVEDAADTVVEKTGPVGEGAAAAGDFVTDIGAGAANAVGDASKSVVDTAAELVSSFTRFAKKVLPGGDLLVRIGESMLGSAWNAISGTIDTLSGMLGTVADVVIDTPGALANVLDGGIGWAVEGVKNNVIRPMADELFKYIKSRGSMATKALATSPAGLGILALGKVITPVQGQLDRVVERYADPNAVADGLPGEQAKARKMGGLGVDWVNERAGITRNAHNNFSQGVTDIPGIGSKLGTVWDNLTALARHVGNSDWQNAVPKAVDVMESFGRFITDLTGVLAGLTVGPLINAAFGLWSTLELTAWSDFAVRGIERGERVEKTEIIGELK